MSDGFSFACGYKRTNVVRFLLDMGMDVNAKLRSHGQTGMHAAAFAGDVETVGLLLEKGSDVHATDDTWHTTPLMWALYAWSDEPQSPPQSYYEVAALLVAAGSVVKPEWRASDKLRADPRMLAAQGLDLDFRQLRSVSIELSHPTHPPSR